MPLEKGSSKSAIQANVATEIAAGKDPKQAAAIAYHVAGKDQDDAPAAGLVLITRDSRVLLLQRAAGDWGFPGGHVEPGETDQQAALRECFEETGQQCDETLMDLGQYGNFHAFGAQLDLPFDPHLNGEHIAAMWARLDDLPQPLHGCTAAALASATGDDAESARIEDINGWFEVKDNPLSKVGVFPYRGRNIPRERARGNMDEPVMVYRSAEELSDPECVDSFRLVPWVIDHTLLGDGTNGTVPIEEKGARGVTGEQIYFDANDGDGVLKGNIKCFSPTLAQFIDRRSPELSLGYRALYEYAPGTFNGIPYTYVQRCIRGNHLASVGSGRMGPEIAVMDAAEIEEIKPMKPSKLKSLRTSLLQYAKDAAEEAAKDGGTEIAEAIKVIEQVAPLIEKIEDIKAVDDAVPAMETPAGDADPADTTKPASGDETAPGTKDAAEGGEMDEAKIVAIVRKVMAEEQGKEKPAPTMDAREVFREVAGRDKLASRCAEFIGVFDAAEMTTSDVATYALGKLGLTAPKGHEVAVVEAWLKDRVPARKLPLTAVGDSADKGADWLVKQLPAA